MSADGDSVAASYHHNLVFTDAHKEFVAHDLPTYREFVLKYLLTFGLEPTHTFYESPLWKEYAPAITFMNVLGFARASIIDGTPSYPFALREGVVEFVTGKDGHA